jgi:hydrogenase expression/formation protein HypD
MLRVPGSQSSVLEAKARGSDVRILYSPLEAVAIAQKNPDKQVVFFAVGFETTAPANALAVEHASKSGLANFSILTSHVLVPPAIEAILQDEETRIDGFLAAGHVCTVMGMEEYYPIVEKYQVPIVVTGFEPIDLLTGVLMVVKQLESGEHKLENQYSRVVKTEGNANAKALIDRVFKITDRAWRGIGNIAESGYEVRSSLDQFNANKKFNIYIEEVNENARCIAGQVLKGIKKPHECPEFGKNCTPLNPLGAPMVSSEGACAAYYNFSRAQEEIPD